MWRCCFFLTRTDCSVLCIPDAVWRPTEKGTDSSAQKFGTLNLTPEGKPFGCKKNAQGGCGLFTWKGACGEPRTSFAACVPNIL